MPKPVAALACAAPPQSTAGASRTGPVQSLDRCLLLTFWLGLAALYA
jgi:hypothetical protein